MNKNGKVLAIVALVFTCIGAIAFIASTIWFASGITEIAKYNPNDDSMSALGVALSLALLIYSALIHGFIEIPTLICGGISVARKNKMGKVVVLINVALIAITIIYFIIFFVYGVSRGAFNLS